MRIWVWGLGCGVGWRVRVQGVCCSPPEAALDPPPPHPHHPCGFGVWGLGFSVWGLGIRHYSLWVRVLGFAFWTPDFQIRFWGFGFRVPGSRVWVTFCRVMFRVPSLGFLGSGLRVLGFLDSEFRVDGVSALPLPELVLCPRQGFGFLCSGFRVVAALSLRLKDLVGPVTRVKKNKKFRSSSGRRLNVARLGGTFNAILSPVLH